MSEPSFEVAFAAVFADRSAPLYRYLSGLSGDPALAQDIVQECFVKLFQRGRMPDDPRAWLVTVANNLWRDDRRRESRRARLLLHKSGELSAPDEPASADAGTLAAERIAAVRQALAKLPERDRQLLLLRHEGFAYREIAAALNVAPGGIGTMLARASAAFREVYRELDGPSD